MEMSEPMLRETARHIDGRHNVQLFRMDAARPTFPDLLDLCSNAPGCGPSRTSQGQHAENLNPRQLPADD